MLPAIPINQNASFVNGMGKMLKRFQTQFTSKVKKM
jgi:hypothetical protein